MYTRPVSKGNLIAYLQHENENLLLLKPDQLLCVLQDIVHTVISEPAAEAIATAVLTRQPVVHTEMQAALQLIIEYISPCLYQYSVLRDVLFGFDSTHKDYFLVFEQVRLALIQEKRCLLFIDDRLNELLADLEQDEFAYQDEMTALFEHDVMRAYLSGHRDCVTDEEARAASIKLFRAELHQQHSAYPQFDALKIMLEIYKKPMAIGQIPLLDEQLLPLFIEKKDSLLAGHLPALSKMVKAKVSFDAFSQNHDKHPDYNDSDDYYYKMLVRGAPQNCA